MDTIKFPHWAKVDGVYYRPNTPIKVENAEAYVADGAVVVEKMAAAPKAKAPAKRTKKQPEPEQRAE